MKTYGGVKNLFGIHTIKVMLQDDDFKGSFTFKTEGLCRGITGFYFNIGDYDGDAIENFVTDPGTVIRRLDDDYLSLHVTLINDNGDTGIYEITDYIFMDMVVGLQIIDFEELEIDE